MLTRGSFVPTNAKRLVLVVDDEQINREMLGYMLENDYDVIYAENGRQALELIREHAKVLSLVLLDVLMPEMDGLEVLRILKQDAQLERIPVIVLTTEKALEVESLHLGASDFIPKPYDLPEIVLARVKHTIKLSESNTIIRTTEDDELTGLYTQTFFFRYAEQYDLYRKDMAMDAVAVDISHFHMINELNGHDYGDLLLKTLADAIRAYVREVGGIACRKEADVFFLYCPHTEDYSPVVERLQAALDTVSPDHQIHLRLGVCPNGDRSVSLRRCFGRAKRAIDTIRRDGRQIAVYDNELYEKELFSQRLLNEMDEALKNRQFQVFYQPKYNIRGDVPKLSSAEALVRWHHPSLGMISPAVFIPLFEENGLIPRLDQYVWREAAAQIARWREKFGVTVPVSVNVSRVDMYDPAFIDIVTGIVKENALSPADLPLEVTESAYTQNADTLLTTVNELRQKGFKIEMDDFGSGYSSLNMLAELPLDFIKLDMLFMRRLETNQKSRHIIKLMIDIAAYLKVPVIAEGVETEEQLKLLKDMGCDVIQGYYFSKPVDAASFEKFIVAEAACSQPV